ncbi:MAG: hypothetical protein GX660_05375 [Clostridiaceae bacterium]|nr:hypothetical protein [Clostridiaceae bacterium]
MEWYYNIRKRRRIQRIAITISLLAGLFIASRSFYSSYQNRINSDCNADSFQDKKEAGYIKLSPIPTAAVAAVKEPDATETGTSVLFTCAEAEAESQQMPVITPVPEALIEKDSQDETIRLDEAAARTIKPATPDTKSTVSPATVLKQPSQEDTTPSPQKTIQPVIKKIDRDESNTESIALWYRNEEAGANTKVVYPVFKIINMGKETVKLSDIAIRYYYTKEGSENETYWYDWFTKSQTLVHGEFSKLPAAKNNADHCLEIMLKSSKDTLGPGESAEIKIGFAKNDWTEYNQLNDYSFNPSTRYIDWNHVTLYVSGRLVYGKEP